MHFLYRVNATTLYVLLFKTKKMNITIYLTEQLNNWLLYFIYLHKRFISVITIIADQLD